MTPVPVTTSALAYGRTLFFFATGGALGTLLRAWFNYLLPHEPWPWHTFAVNLLGSLLIGLLLEAGHKVHMHVRAFHAVGFCGGLTTFSAFAVEVVRMLEQGQLALALAYIAASVAGCIFAVWAGFRLTGLKFRREMRRPL